MSDGQVVDMMMMVVVVMVVVRARPCNSVVGNFVF